MTDNELIDLCVTCGCGLTFSNCYYNCYFKPGDDVDMTLKSLRKSTTANVLLPANFHWYGTWHGTCSTSSMMLFALSRATGNSSWRILCTFSEIIIKEFIDDKGFTDVGLMTSSLESPTDQLKFDEQVNRMSLESLKDVVFGIVRNCNNKTKEMRRTEILAPSKEWTVTV